MEIAVDPRPPGTMWQSQNFSPALLASKPLPLHQGSCQETSGWEALDSWQGGSQWGEYAVVE